MLDTVQIPAPAFRQLIDRKPISKSAVDRFLSCHSFPLQTDSGSTFVYRGDADHVELHHWVYGAPGPQEFTRVEETDLWFLTLELPTCSRIEYKLVVESSGKRKLIRDRLNPLEAHDPFGANSVCHGPGYSTPDWTRDQPGVPRGDTEILEIESEIFGETRLVDVYRPASNTAAADHPLLIVHDGNDFVRYSSLLTVLDNLIHRGEIAPLIVALTNSHERLVEYAGDPRHARFLADELLPALTNQFPVADIAASRGLLGASFGAVASLHTSWLYPGLFGRLALHSGSFAFHRRKPTKGTDEMAPVVAFQRLFRTSPRRPSDRVYVSCGQYESLIVENRELVPILEETGMEVRYSEARDGHNWENWRDRLQEALTYLFPGPAVELIG